MIEIFDVEEKVIASVYNVLGNVLHEQIFNPGPDRNLKEEMDLSFLPRGVYLFKLHTNKGLMVTQIILK